MDSRKHEADEEEQAFLPQAGFREDANADGPSEQPTRHKSRRRQVTWWLRLLLDIGMAVTIVYLLVFKPFVVSRETIRRTPVPRCTFTLPFPLLLLLLLLLTQWCQVPRKIYTFRNNPKYVNDDMWFNESLTLRTLHNWIELSSGMPRRMVTHVEERDHSHPPRQQAEATSSWTTPAAMTCRIRTRYRSTGTGTDRGT
jgi:hypothetical protein